MVEAPQMIVLQSMDLAALGFQRVVEHIHVKEEGLRTALHVGGVPRQHGVKYNGFDAIMRHHMAGKPNHQHCNVSSPRFVGFPEVCQVVAADVQYYNGRRKTGESTFRFPQMTDKIYALCRSVKAADSVFKIGLLGSHFRYEEPAVRDVPAFEIPIFWDDQWVSQSTNKRMSNQEHIGVIHVTYGWLITERTAKMALIIRLDMISVLP